VDIHPPWIIHDLFADVIAGALELTHHLCNHNHHHNHIYYHDTQNNNITTVSIIETDLDPWKQFRESSQSNDSLVVLNEEATVAQAPFLTPEEIRALPYGWKLYQDRVGKPGWIIEGNKTVVKSAIQKQLIFNCPYQYASHGSTTKTPTLATLEVTYMQTYHHAGGFKVAMLSLRPGKNNSKSWIHISTNLSPR
jgi:hypothetical protein